MRTLFALFTALLLAACASPSSVPPPVVYACEDGSVLNVRFVPEGAYVSTAGAQEILLPQLPTASGISHGTAQYQLRGKGDEATWTVGRRVPTACRVRR